MDIPNYERRVQTMLSQDRIDNPEVGPEVVVTAFSSQLANWCLVRFSALSGLHYHELKPELINRPSTEDLRLLEPLYSLKWEQINTIVMEGHQLTLRAWHYSGREDMVDKLTFPTGERGFLQMQMLVKSMINYRIAHDEAPGVVTNRVYFETTIPDDKTRKLDFLCRPIHYKENPFITMVQLRDLEERESDVQCESVISSRKDETEEVFTMEL